MAIEKTICHMKYVSNGVWWEELLNKNFSYILMVRKLDKS